MVGLSVKASSPSGASFKQWVRDCRDIATDAQMYGIGRGGRAALVDMRNQMKSAGLGSRLPNALRGTQYPDPARDKSLRTEYVIQPKDGQATAIFAAFTTGASIRGRSGNWLAIPSDNVPKVASGRGSPRSMTPEEVEAAFNQDLIIHKTMKPNVFVAFVKAVNAKSRKGFRRGTKRRLAQGRDLRLVLMFTLVRQVRLRARLDPAPILEKWAAQVPFFINSYLQGKV